MKMSLSRKYTLGTHQHNHLPSTLNPHNTQAEHTDGTRYKIGDSFFQLPLPDAQSLLSTSSEQIDADVSKLEEQLGELREELQSLKVALYARFGRSINLET